jgi:CHAT domain-containing protein
MNRREFITAFGAAVVGLVFFSPTATFSEAPSAAFVAPPRTIADIAAILDQEKPDATTIAELKAKADKVVPTKVSRAQLAEFYYDRSQARGLLGRFQDAVADAEKAVEIGRGASDPKQFGVFEQGLALAYDAAGGAKKSLAIFLAMTREYDRPGVRGRLFNTYRHTVQKLILTGDIPLAETYVRRAAALLQEARAMQLPGWRQNYPRMRNGWESDAEAARGALLEARGQFREAEASYQRTEALRRASIKDRHLWDFAPPESQLRLAADGFVLAMGRMKARQGRLAEAEIDVRRALLGRLKDQGKYNPRTTRFVMGLAEILVEQGRYPEAEKLTRTALEINRTIGVADEAPTTAHILSQLGGILNLQRRPAAAAQVYAQLDKAIANWEPQRRQQLELNNSRIYSLYASGQVDAGIAAAQDLLKREVARVGEKHFDTAVARGTLALGYVKAGRDADALKEFRIAIPIMMASAREAADDEDTTLVAARSQRLQTIVEAYIAMLARGERNAEAVAIETFALADAIRGHSVQQALTASSVRMVVKDAALAELVRKQQDLTKQVNAQLGLLNNVLALPPAERDERGIKAINAQIEKLRAERDKARADIGKRFPNYADLIDPKAPSVNEIKAILKPGEALLSFYFGIDASFAWAVPKEGPIAFAAFAATAGDVQSKISHLREALEPQGARVSDIPEFDLLVAYGLYELLLKPIEPGWKAAKSLIVVTNGALGLLPLSLLPTQPVQPRQPGGKEDVWFAAYGDVPWLARTHAVTLVPSAAALKTLRQIPPGSGKREPMIGFGDPIFSRAQLTEAEQQASEPPLQVAELTARGIPLRRRSSPQLDNVDSADLALLPRLPDTAEELKSIALALEVDPAKVLNLGIKANETTVKSTDLSRYKIIVFATHGLVPGELNGLTQPALALSAPEVAGVEGDGLLTMEEILALKLNADWVVLSACNTGTGAGAGAEAASGLGRAFFYAGTRAILVTNWSVDSDAARELTTDLFRRQAADGTLARAEALRQSMLALIDGAGFKDERGRILFSYAHPLFWAPYSIIGDGGSLSDR